jgi:hypothetical protein
MMSDAATSSLALDQVVDLISRAKAGGANPTLIGMQIFNELGNDVVLTGSTLTLALRASQIAIDPALMTLVEATQTVSKTGNHVNVSLNQLVEVQQKVRLKFEQGMNFDVSNGTRFYEESFAPGGNPVQSLGERQRI